MHDDQNDSCIVEACARDKKAHDYLFTRDKGERGAGKPVVSYRRAWAKVCSKSGTPGLRLHDLRRSAVRNMVPAGVPEHTAMKIRVITRTRSLIVTTSLTSARSRAQWIGSRRREARLTRRLSRFRFRRRSAHQRR